MPPDDFSFGWKYPTCLSVYNDVLRKSSTADFWLSQTRPVQLDWNAYKQWQEAFDVIDFAISWSTWWWTDLFDGHILTTREGGKSYSLHSGQRPYSIIFPQSIGLSNKFQRQCLHDRLACRIWRNIVRIILYCIIIELSYCGDKIRIALFAIVTVSFTESIFVDWTVALPFCVCCVVNESLDITSKITSSGASFIDV